MYLILIANKTNKQQQQKKYCPVWAILAQERDQWEAPVNLTKNYHVL
jgi:hypothetical protein